MEMAEIDGGVVLNFSGNNVKQLVSTIDEVLEHVQLALEATV
ncbi:hypothetical protein CENSYa_0101 [Cenarchaeum symbiosum A]|uniref:Uncharacterized protein n=1 Tax=Cenarchaeum symbiosum (strain A) TaxID=414004 RepID=A0RTS9_CENSY|nr:hypothetical protein CENSYa_0101 [Cenarchaeum symbiosum A]